jgi:hypothetical protein
VSVPFTAMLSRLTSTPKTGQNLHGETTVLSGRESLLFFPRHLDRAVQTLRHRRH